MPRRASLLLSVLVLALAVHGGATPASAEAALFRFQGQAASAFLLFVQPGDVQGSFVITEVFVFAVSGKVRLGAGGPASGSLAIVLVSQAVVLGTEATPLFLSVGTVEGAPVTFDAEFPQVPTAAGLSAAIPGFDFVSGIPTTVALDVMWTGSGSPVHVNSLVRTVVDGLVLSERTNGFVRPMTAVVGTVSGTPVPIAAPPIPGPPPPDAPAAAFLGSFNVGTVAVS